METILNINDLFVKANKKQILKGLNLKINKGETHVIMGPNGAGKTTLLNAILNNPSFEKTKGQILFCGEDITNEKTDKIAKKGVFLSFQSPQEIEGISVFNFIKTAKQQQTGENVNYFDLKDDLEEKAQTLNMREELLSRDLNVGFSGGEKKKNEILQLLSLNPTLAMLDETDSGLDVDAIRIVSRGVKSFKTDQNAILVVTHSAKMAKELEPDFVHILIDGKIVKTGGKAFIDQVEKDGFKNF